MSNGQMELLFDAVERYREMTNPGWIYIVVDVGYEVMKIGYAKSLQHSIDRIKRAERWIKKLTKGKRTYLAFRECIDNAWQEEKKLHSSSIAKRCRIPGSHDLDEYYSVPEILRNEQPIIINECNGIPQLWLRALEHARPGFSPGYVFKRKNIDPCHRLPESTEDILFYEKRCPQCVRFPPEGSVVFIGGHCHKVVDSLGVIWEKCIRCDGYIPKDKPFRHDDGRILVADNGKYVWKELKDIRCPRSL